MSATFGADKATDKEKDDSTDNPDIGNVSNKPVPVTNEINNVSVTPAWVLDKSVDKVARCPAQEKSAAKGKEARTNAGKIHNDCSNNDAGNACEDDRCMRSQ